MTVDSLLKEDELIANYTSSSSNSLDILVQELELLIPESDKRLNGAFFTPDYVVNYIIEEIDPQPSDLNLDPACGCGVFLLGLVEFYRKKYGKSIRDIVRENIFGADILDYNIRRAKKLLSIYALEHGELLEESDFNLYIWDSLRAEWRLSFDNIVGNPPYVRFQDLSEESRLSLDNQWLSINGGAYNLYFAFFELGYQLLKDDGKLGFITPNNYFTSLAGESLRRFFKDKKCVTKIIDFNSHKVFKAQTYTAITFLSKKEQEHIAYDRMEQEKSTTDFLGNLNLSYNKLSDLNPKKWRLLKSDERENIFQIEHIGTSLSELLNISAGIATLKDEIYFVDGTFEDNGYYIKTTSEGIFKIESSITSPVYKISDFKSQQSILSNKRRVICPYRMINGIMSVIPEYEFQQLFPQCYAYLLTKKEVLDNRDKGKKVQNPFYSWGRTQGLSGKEVRLLTPTFSKKPRFLIAQDYNAFFTNGYGLSYKNNFNSHLIIRPSNIDVLQKILNSEIMHYYIRKTSVSIEGGYPCYQKNFIERFTIPSLTETNIQTLRNLTQTIEITQFLIEKYQLNNNILA